MECWLSFVFFSFFVVAFTFSVKNIDYSWKKII